MNPAEQAGVIENRRQFFGRATTGIGTLALASLLNPKLFAESGGDGLALRHFAPRAKRVIYLLRSGAPSQMELLD